jgi:phosphomannomutase
VNVQALDQASMRSEAVGATAGVVSVGVVTATATQSGSVATTVSGQHSGTGWTAQAERDATADAQATGGSAGVYAGSGAGATAKDSGSVTLTLASNTVLNAGTGDLSLLAQSTPSADAYALGVSVGRGAGMGVSVALSEVYTSGQVLANGPLSLSGKNMLVNAVLGHGDSSVTAKAVAGGGGLLLGAQGAGATASNKGTATVTFSNGATLAATGDVAIMVTASHNPIEYNGFKVCKRGGVPLDLATEFAAWQTYTLAWMNTAAPTDFPEIPSLSLREAYVTHLLSLVDTAAIPAQTIVINAGNGAAGPTADAILAHLPQLKVVRVHHAPDGSFPNGIPNPLLPGNRASTAEAVRANSATLGVAWDGDFDRCFFYDETGAFISGYYTATLLAEAVLQRPNGENAGAPIVHDPRLYWATVAAIQNAGGTAHSAKVGHGFIKPKMRELNSPFAGEISSHFYFRDFYSCDSGMLPMLMLLALLGQKNQTLGQAVAKLAATCPATDELNFNTPTPAKQFLAALEPHLLPLAPAHTRTDGLELIDEATGWRASIRASSNEPLLRLNLEARSAATLTAWQSKLVNLLQTHGATAADGH